MEPKKYYYIIDWRINIQVAFNFNKAIRSIRKKHGKNPSYFSKKYPWKQF